VSAFGFGLRIIGSILLRSSRVADPHPIADRWPRPWCGRQWRLVRSFVAVREASAIVFEARARARLCTYLFQYTNIATKVNEGMITRSAVSAVMRK
jgi:hypothetical protein